MEPYRAQCRLRLDSPVDRELSAELRRGVVLQYQHQRDDWAGVKGKIAVSRQVGALFNRMDRAACEWDELRADTPFNRLLKCACLEVRKRAQTRANARALRSRAVCWAIAPPCCVRPPLSRRLWRCAKRSA